MRLVSQFVSGMDDYTIYRLVFSPNSTQIHTDEKLYLCFVSCLRKSQSWCNNSDNLNVYFKQKRIYLKVCGK